MPCARKLAVPHPARGAAGNMSAVSTRASEASAVSIASRAFGTHCTAVRRPWESALGAEPQTTWPGAYLHGRSSSGFLIRKAQGLCASAAPLPDDGLRHQIRDPVAL